MVAPVLLLLTKTVKKSLIEKSPNKIKDEKLEVLKIIKLK